MCELKSSEPLKQGNKYKRFLYSQNDLVDAVESIVSTNTQSGTQGNRNT